LGIILNSKIQKFLERYSPGVYEYLDEQINKLTINHKKLLDKKNSLNHKYDIKKFCNILNILNNVYELINTQD